MKVDGAPTRCGRVTTSPPGGVGEHPIRKLVRKMVLEQMAMKKNGREKRGNEKGAMKSGHEKRGRE